MIYRQNIHTHTTYCDGKDTPEELIRRAQELGFDCIGFSGHSYMHYSENHSMSQAGTKEYIRKIRDLQKKYADEIEVYCGLELDMYSVVDLSAYDYIIGAMHYFYRNGRYIGFDRSAEVVKGVIDEEFGGDGLRYARAYYEDLTKLPDCGKIDIVGHFDLIAKHAETERFFDTDDKKYQAYALDALHILAEKIKIFEINTGAIARGYRTTPYPAPFLLKEMKRLGCRIIISSDCHDKNQLDCHFQDAVEYAKSCGFDELAILRKGEFTGVKI